MYFVSPTTNIAQRIGRLRGQIDPQSGVADEASLLANREVKEDGGAPASLPKRRHLTRKGQRSALQLLHHFYFRMSFYLRYSECLMSIRPHIMSIRLWRKIYNMSIRLRRKQQYMSIRPQ